VPLTDLEVEREAGRVSPAHQSHQPQCQAPETSWEGAMASKPIVVGCDGSDGSELALGWALQAARGRRAPVRIVNAVVPPVNPLPTHISYTPADPAVLMEAAEQTLGAALATARRTAPAVEVDTHMAYGEVAATLIEESIDAEMIVVGSRGLRGFSGLLVGSTGIALAAHAHCPVVVIRPERDGVEPGPEAGRVVVGVDGSALSTEAVGFAVEEASLRGRGLTAIHVWQSPYVDSPDKGAPIPGSIMATEFGGQEMRALTDALAVWGQKCPAVEIREVVVHANPAAALVAASAGAELVVVGSRGRGGFRSLLLGSVSHALLHHAHCPVAVVRPTG
jgi:nucleotide-binding universal stress UspA family protein